MRSTVDDVLRPPFASLDDSSQHLRQGSTIVNLYTRSLFSFLSAGFVHCLNARYASALASILLLAIGSAASHQALATPKVGLQDLLLEFERKGIVADFEIEKVPNRSADEVDRIMGVLDKIMAKEGPRIFEVHYQEVEKSIQNISIPENFSDFEVYLESRKEVLGIDGTVLDTLVRNFMSQTETSIEPLHARVSEIIDAKVSDALTSEMIQARSSIREPFQDVILNHFPDWPVPDFRGPSLPLFSELTDLTSRDASVPLGIPVVVGGIIIARAKEKIRKKVVGKVVGRVGTATGTGPLGVLMIVIGTGLEVRDLLKAKEDLEQMLREEILRAYRTEFSVASVWGSVSGEDASSPRRRFAEKVSRNLDRWFELCREEAKEQNALAGIVTLSPPVRDYIAETTRKDTKTTDVEIRAHIDLVGRVFPIEMVSSEPTKELLNMAFAAPDREELKYLTHELGDSLLVEYRQHGNDVLVAANRLGTGIFVQVVRSGEQLNWFDARRAFEQYPSNMSERARRGLLLAIRAQVARSSPVDTATLESISRSEALFLRAAPLLQQDIGKLYGLFAGAPAMAVVRRAFQEDADIARVLLIEWPLRTWDRYRDGDRLDVLFQVAAYRVDRQGQEIGDFAREVAEQDWLTPLFVESGLCAVQLRDTYAGPGAGRRQRKEAENAVALLNKGYPCDLLLKRKGFDDVELYDKVTFGYGQPYFHRLYPILEFIYVAILLVIGVPVLVFVIPRLRMAFSRKRHTNSERTRVAVPAREDSHGKIIESAGTVGVQKGGE